MYSTKSRYCGLRPFSIGAVVPTIAQHLVERGFFMDKNEFFRKLDEDLAQKHGISFHHVNTIRSFVLGSGKTRKEVAEWAAIKLSQPSRWKSGLSKIGRRERNREHYQTILNFVASCTSQQWDDITQVTQFDQPKEEPAHAIHN